MKKNKVMSLWNDAYVGCHQFIADADKNILYERWRDDKDVEFFNVKMRLSAWGSWEKLVKPRSMDKAWKVRDMSIEDFIEGNYE